MANNQTQRQRQEQRQMVLQRQLGRLMEMSNTELADEVAKQLAENSGLEVTREHSDDLSDHIGAEDDGRDKEPAMDFDTGGDNDDDGDSPAYRASNRSADDEVYTPTVVAEVTLAEHLGEQLAERDLTPKQATIAEHIIGNLDADGYLQRSPRDIADDITFGEGIETETAEVREVLHMVQQLDPPGIAATSVQESLLLQLRQRPRTVDTRTAIAIVEGQFDRLSAHRYDLIAAALEIDEERVKEVVASEIQTLQPRPAGGYAGSRSDMAAHITPDFEVTPDDDGFTVTLLNRIPELQIAQSYATTLEGYDHRTVVTREQREQMQVIRANYDKAQLFLNVLRMRQHNLFMVMNAIVERQRAYFASGDTSDLVPLRMQDIADATGYDVSSISRAVSNKYVATPWGVKPLKHFFASGISPRKSGTAGTEADDVTTRQVKEALAALIAAEDKRHPLSDDRLAKLLAEQGYPIARRTVAKYRDQLGILKASLRNA